MRCPITSSYGLDMTAFTKNVKAFLGHPVGSAYPSFFEQGNGSVVRRRMPSIKYQ